MRIKLFLILFLCSSSLFAQDYWTIQQRRGMTPRYFQRDISLTWRYEWVNPKIGESYSYFSQDYSLDLYGPLIFPALGKSKISLNYRMGKNIFPREWWSLWGNVDQRSLSYHLSTYFSPTYINRFFSSSFDISRSITNPGMLQQVSESQQVSGNLYPPFKINLGRIFSRSRNQGSRSRRSRQQNGFLLTLPTFSYSFRRGDSRQLTYYNQRTTFEKIGVSWRISSLSLGYTRDTNKNYDLLFGKKLVREGSSQYLDSSLLLNKPLPGLENALLSGRYSRIEEIYPLPYRRENLTSSAILVSKRLTLLNWNHYLQYTNGMKWDPVKITPVEFGHSLSLFSDCLRRPGGFSLRNALTYKRNSAKEIKPVSQGVYEELFWGFWPLKIVSLTGSVGEGYSWTDGMSKIAQTKAAGHIHLHLNGVGAEINSVFLQEKDLLAKKITAKTIDGNLSCSTQFRPLAYFLNNNNRNHNKNNNFYSNVLQLGLRYQVRFSRNLLTKGTSIDYYEDYSLSSAPFNDYLSIIITYKRIRGTSPYEELSTEISSGRLLQYKGFTLKINIYSRNLRRPNILVSLEYGGTLGGLSLGYRVLNIGTDNPVGILSLSYTRKF